MNSVHGVLSSTGRVAPFGNLRIKARLRLPEAYRSLPRPSSPAGAKASIMCSLQLDHPETHVPGAAALDCCYESPCLQLLTTCYYPLGKPARAFREKDAHRSSGFQCHTEDSLLHFLCRCQRAGPLPDASASFRRPKKPWAGRPPPPPSRREDGGRIWS